MAVLCRRSIRCYRYVRACLDFRLGSCYVSLRHQAADRHLFRVFRIHLVLYDHGHRTVVCHLIRTVSRRCILDQTVIRRRTAQVVQADRLDLPVVPAEGYRLGCCIFCYRGVGVLQTGNRSFRRVAGIIRHGQRRCTLCRFSICSIGCHTRAYILVCLCRSRLNRGIAYVDLHYAVSCYFCRCICAIGEVQAFVQCYGLAIRSIRLVAQRNFFCGIRSINTDGVGVGILRIGYDSVYSLNSYFIAQTCFKAVIASIFENNLLRHVTLCYKILNRYRFNSTVNLILHIQC